MVLPSALQAKRSTHPNHLQLSKKWKYVCIFVCSSQKRPRRCRGKHRIAWPPLTLKHVVSFNRNRVCAPFFRVRSRSFSLLCLSVKPLSLSVIVTIPVNNLLPQLLTFGNSRDFFPNARFSYCMVCVCVCIWYPPNLNATRLLFVCDVLTHQKLLPAPLWMKMV